MRPVLESEVAHANHGHPNRCAQHFLTNIYYLLSLSMSCYSGLLVGLLAFLQNTTLLAINLKASWRANFHAPQASLKSCNKFGEME